MDKDNTIKSEDKKDRIFYILQMASFVAGLCFFTFFAGLYVDHYRVFPYKLIKNASDGARALKEKYTHVFVEMRGGKKHEIYEYLWFKVPFDQKGVVRYDKSKTADGLNFFTNHTSEAFLMDMEGKIIHQWAKPFYEVWPNPTHIISKAEERFIHWRLARPLPDGSLIAIYESGNQAPYGGGLIRIDKDSNLLWKVDINAHHDFFVDNQGNTHALFHEYGYKDKAIISDGIAVISPDGKIISKKYLLDIIRDSQYRWILPQNLPRDPLHTNNIDILTPEMASSFPKFKVGDILLSLREINTIMIIDSQTNEIKWTTMGVSYRQHDPDFLKNGKVMLFDNQSETGRSRILEIDTDTMKTSILYEGSKEKYFYSIYRGSQQVLKNGNILITESCRGRIFEITPEGETVWEYIATSLMGESIGVICGAMRYSKDELKFLNQ